MSRPVYTVTIAFEPGSTGGSPYMIRQVLESFGVRVIMHDIGRPDDFIDLISGDYYIDSDYIILEFHGDEGKICMPELGEEYYHPDEPRGDFDKGEIEKYFKLKDVFVINLGCTLGRPELALSFIKSGCKVYIGARDYVDGISSDMFVIRFFYEMIQNGRSEKEAFEIAKNTDKETDFFDWYEKS